MAENLILRHLDKRNIFMEPFSADFFPKFIKNERYSKFRTAEKVAKSFNGYLCIGKEHPLKIDSRFFILHAKSDVLKY